jgi:hypothetical protein
MLKYLIIQIQIQIGLLTLYKICTFYVQMYVHASLHFQEAIMMTEQLAGSASGSEYFTWQQWVMTKLPNSRLETQNNALKRPVLNTGQLTFI